MGRRSRKRRTAPAAAGGPAARRPTPETSAGASPHAAPPSHRARMAEAPKAPWSPFPLVEICVLIALVLIVVGAVSDGPRRGVFLACGLALACLAGLELAVREHFAGYRSHSMLLAGAVALVAMVLTFVIGGASGVPILILPVAVVVFAAAFWWFRRAFSRRTGGVSFR